MKKTFTTLFLTLTTAFAFADESSAPVAINEVVVLDTKPIAVESLAKGGSYTYLRMGVTDTYPADSVQIIPGVGLGYRYQVGNGAIDLSGNYNRAGADTAYFYKGQVAYMHYLSPESNQSFYGGVGAAYGGLKNKAADQFTGLIGNGYLGFEMNRKENFRSFMQLDVSQPAYALTQEGNFPGPIAEISLGFGY